MENYRNVNFFLMIAAGIFLFPLFIFAYDKETTHPALTSETIAFFNKNYPELYLGDTEKGIIIQGSIDEDDGARPLQHFYDPMYERGLTLGKEWSSSKKWARNTLAQASYAFDFLANPLERLLLGTVQEVYSNDSDYSWERAVHDYAWGDQERGLKALGHILHLIQDAGVPAHTRNDPHPPVMELGSPYEYWAAQFDAGNIIISENLSFVPLKTFSSIDDSFNSLARYSNNNFFSKNTVLNPRYENPQIEYYQKGIGFHIFDKGDSHPVVRKIKELDGSTSYTLIDKESTVLSDYWRLLSRQAVLHGAGVVKLFFDEVEKERQTKALALKNRNWAQRIYDGTAGALFGIADRLYGISVPYEELNTPGMETVRMKTGESVGPTVENRASRSGLSPSSQSSSSLRPDLNAGLPQSVFETEVPQYVLERIEKLQKEFNKLSVENSAPRPGLSPSSQSSSSLRPSLTEGLPQAMEDFDEALFNSTPNPYQPGFGGGGGGTPPPPQESEPEDTTPPDITLTSGECDDSLATAGCLVATTTLTFSWNSTAEDLAYFEINQNGVASTTTATSTEIIVNDNSVYTFSVSAVDTTGNTSDLAVESVEVATSPVIINEIAWMGTAASASDEWIELYNQTGKEVSFTDWGIYKGGGVSLLGLSGSIPAGGYYLIERTDDTTVNDTTADLVTPFSAGGLTNGGEVLTLARVSGGATTTIDKTPALSDCGGGWCAGNNTSKKTMERVSHQVSGEDANNWATALGEFILNGEDANSAPLKGTPKTKNSVSYLIAADGSLDENKTLTEADSPYLVDRQGLMVAGGVTLTLLPGVVVKVVNPQEPSIDIAGTIISSGTALKPIVFTSFSDDDYGGDMNGDGASSGSSGDWTRITIESTSSGSSFENTIVRYGGRSKTTYEAALVVDSTDASFDAVTILYSGKHGLYLDGSGSTVTNSIFSYNDAVNAAGIYVDGVPGGAPVVSGNTLIENDYGLWAQAAIDLSATGNTFTNNNTAAVIISGATGSFSGNTGSGNGFNALLFSGAFAYGSAVMSANTLPYLVQQDFEVKASSTLAIADGVVIKGYDNTAGLAGRIVVKGGASITSSGGSQADIIFTSIHDDTYGGDTAGNGTSTAPLAGDWYGFVVEDGGWLDMAGFTLRYAGGLTTQSGDDKGGIKIIGDVATSTLATALFDNNYQYGVHVKNGGALVVSDTTFGNHTSGKTANYAAVFANDSTISLSDITFSNNDNLDIRAAGAYSVSCTNCGTPVTDPDPL